MGDNPMRTICRQPLLLRAVMSSMGWTAANLGYYGLSYSAGNLSQDVYTNVGLFSVADMVGYLLSMPAVHWFGRRGTQICSFLAAAVALGVCGVLPSGSWALVACAVAGRFFLDICFTTVYILTVECFPTECRNTAVGACNFVARLVALLAPLCGKLPVFVSCPIFGGVCLLAAFATIMLPETSAGPLEAVVTESLAPESARSGRLTLSTLVASLTAKSATENARSSSRLILVT